MDNRGYVNILNKQPSELLQTQKNNGKPLSFIGDIVYLILCLLGYQQKMFYDICPYFEIGKGWGCLSLGWFLYVVKMRQKKQYVTKCKHWWLEDVGPQSWFRRSLLVS